VGSAAIILANIAIVATLVWHVRAKGRRSEAEAAPL
jgi:hypothetical protein